MQRGPRGNCPRCPPLNPALDGAYDCDDKSDEKMCNCPSYRQFECDCYQSDGGCGGWRGCIEQSYVCIGHYDCPDKSDEKMCGCPSYRPFERDCYQSEDGCAGKSGCITQSRICNGTNNCGDWSDEKYRLSTTLYCRNDECVERSKVNDGKVDMTGRYDEFLCCLTQGHKCGYNPGNDNCTSSGKCIPNIWIGDGRDDCVTSHSDESCDAIKGQCENCQVIINRCETNKDKIFLLQISKENTTTCHMNNLSFHHLNLSTNGSAFHLCVENVWERSFNVKTDGSSTIVIIATQMCSVEMGLMNNSKALVSDVQERQEKAPVFCRRKIFTIRRLSAQMVQIYVS